MARIRNSPRKAPRHTGDLYDVGYQYRHPERDALWLGPWHGMQLDGVVDDPSKFFLTIRNARLDNGAIRAFYSSATTSLTGHSPLGAFLFDMDTPRHFYFYDNAATGKLHIEMRTASTVTDTNTGITSAGTLVYAVSWGRSTVYFTYNSVLYKYVIGPVISAVPSAPPFPWLLAVLDNNLLVADSSNDDIWWSVDGAPEDFVNPGSDIHRFSGGGLIGLHVAGNIAYAVGGLTTERIASTGIGSPAFSFTRADITVASGVSSHVATTTHNKLFYITTDGSIRVYDGNASVQPPHLVAIRPTRLFYSRYMDRVVFDRPDGAFWRTFLVNPHTYNIECILNSEASLIAADSPVYNGTGKQFRTYNGPFVRFYNLTTSSYDTPVFVIQELSFHRTVWIDQIVIERPNVDGIITSPDLTLRLFLFNREGVSEQLDITGLEDSISMRFFVNRACDSLRIGNIDANTWQHTDSIKRIGIFYSLEERESAGAT